MTRKTSFSLIARIHQCRFTLFLNHYFFTFIFYKLVLKMKLGQRMGWGIHYSPETRDRSDFSDKDTQLVLCYVTVDVTIVYTKMMLQPAGGWYPVAILHPYGT